MAVKNANVFHCNTFLNLPKFGFFSKYTIWQPWSVASFKSVLKRHRFSVVKTEPKMLKWTRLHQGCQMVYFQTKNPKFW
jgi:hypothetical protein